jgi:hypothetical protein
LFANYSKVGATNQKSTQTTNFINVFGPIITNFEVYVLDAAVCYRQIPDNTLRSLDYLPARFWMASDHVSERLTYNCRSNICVQRCQNGINQTAKRSVTRMSDNDLKEKRKMSLTQTPN